MIDETGTILVGVDGSTNAATAVDWAYRLIGLLALPVYAIALYVPPAQRFFELTPPTGSQWAIVAGYSALAAGTLWLVDRAWSRFAASRTDSPPARW
mgnify:CR=1 FL=1